MIQFVQEFVVKKDARGEFELLFGPGGAWSRRLAHCPGFRGTILLRDTEDPRRYLAIELWEEEGRRERSLAEQQADTFDLADAVAMCTESRRELGSFRLLAEATVRAQGRRRRTEGQRPGRGESRTTR